VNLQSKGLLLRKGTTIKLIKESERNVKGVSYWLLLAAVAGLGGFLLGWFLAWVVFGLGLVQILWLCPKFLAALDSVVVSKILGSSRFCGCIQDSWQLSILLYVYSYQTGDQMPMVASKILDHALHIYTC